MKLDRLITSALAARKIGVTPDHIRKLIRDGKIKAEKVGNVWFIDSRSLSTIKRQRFPRENDDGNGSKE